MKYKNHIKSISFLFVFVFCANCTTVQNLPESFSQFIGIWKSSNSANFEIWTKNEKELVGKLVKIENNDTVLLEKLRIFIANDTCFYEANVPTQNMGNSVKFQLVNQETNTFEFQNEKHDFPKKIVYNFGKNNSLEAIVSGANKSISFKYHKIK